MGSIPTGTVSFLFTDIEGSTRLWERDRAAMARALSRHDAIVGDAVAAHHGYVFATGGDGFCAAFLRASEAVLAAVETQRALEVEDWPQTAELRVRMGIHSGEAQERNGDFFGPTVNRAARLMAAAWGGQVLVSLAAHELLAGADLPGVELVGLGVHRLRDMQAPETIYQVVAEGLVRRFAPLRTIDRARGNLPAPTSSFLGRDAELARLYAELGSVRVVTVVGVGGVGKTRLALQAAADSAEDFEDGVWFCDLTPVADPAAVPYAVGAALGLPERGAGALVETIIQALAQRRALLVVDNCEHVIDQVAEVVDAVVQRCPAVKVLATSREALALSGETIFPLKPLDPSGSAAAELFIARARAGGAEALDDTDSIREICRRLDGIPLAIELAASRSRSMTLGELASNLDQRFQLLGGTRRRAPGRHQTLKLTVDWSYALLTLEDQALFDSLGVFAGGFDVDAAASVTGHPLEDVRRGLARLMDRSLLEAVTTGRTSRYRQLETLRQYAHDRLADSGRLPEAARAHARWCLELAQQARQGIRGPDEALWVERIDAELPNLRAAHAWAIEADDADVALGILAGLWDDAHHRRRFEVGEWAAAAVRLPSAVDHPLRPAAIALQAQVAQMHGRQDLAAEYADQAIAEEERLGGPLFVWSRTTRVAAPAYRGEFSTALELWEMWRPSMIAAADAYEMAWMTVLDTFLHATSDLGYALDRAEAGVAAAEQLGVPAIHAWALYSRGSVLRSTQPARALTDLDRATAIATSVRAWYCADGAATAAVATAPLLGGGDPEVTLRRFEALLRRQIDADDQLRIPTTLRQLALHLAEAGQLTPAAVLLHAETGYPSAPLVTTADPDRYLAAQRRIEQDLDRAAQQASRERGLGLTIVEPVRPHRHRRTALRIIMIERWRPSSGARPSRRAWRRRHVPSTGPRSSAGCCRHSSRSFATT